MNLLAELDADDLPGLSADSLEWADDDLPDDPFGDFDADGPSGRPTINGVIRRCLAQGLLNEILSKSAEAVVDNGYPRRLDDRRAKVLSQLARCRHGGLGARQYKCHGCGARRVTINSCKDRHCPRCARQRRYVWHQQVLSWSLDCDYLHLVLTLPHELNWLVAANQGPLLRLLFECAREAILWLVRKVAGCVPGLILVLHTWGQKLNYHYHIHVVMTAGGLSLDGSRWIDLDQDVMAEQEALLAGRFKKLFMRKLRRLLKTALFDLEQEEQASVSGVSQEEIDREQDSESPAWTTFDDTHAWNPDGEIPAEDEPEPLRLWYPREQPNRQAVEAMLEKLERKSWVCDIEATPQKYRDSGERRKSLGYVGKYVAGSAIGDGRLISFQNGMITFRAYCYRTQQQITITLPEVEFVAAYTRHILPDRLYRFRFAGIFSPQGRTDRMARCRGLIAELRISDTAHDAVSEATDRREVLPLDAACDTLLAAEPAAAEPATPDPLEEGSRVLCHECRQEMSLTRDIEGPDTTWLVRLALFAAHWLSTRPDLAVREAILEVVLQLLARTQCSLEGSRYASLLPDDPFYREELLDIAECLTHQRLAQQIAAERALSAQQLAPEQRGGRGPPSWHGRYL